jgi:hypothetical protein
MSCQINAEGPAEDYYDVEIGQRRFVYWKLHPRTGTSTAQIRFVPFIYGTTVITIVFDLTPLLYLSPYIRPLSI